jgi:hypothetical protein
MIAELIWLDKKGLYLILEQNTVLLLSFHTKRIVYGVQKFT